MLRHWTEISTDEKKRTVVARSLVNHFRPYLRLDPIQVRENRSVNSRYGTPAGLTERRDAYDTVIGSGEHQQRTAAVPLTGVWSSRNICIYYAQHILIQTVGQFTEAGERLGARRSIHYSANYSTIALFFSLFYKNI